MAAFLAENDLRVMVFYLIQRIGRDMRARGKGRILITGSEAGFVPGTFHAVYNGTKAFIDSFSFARSVPSSRTRA